MTRTAFEGAPLSTLNPSLRGNVLAELAREVDCELHAESTLQDPLLNGRVGSAEYDWLRDGLRIECKSSMMAWRSSAKCWHFCFQGVKIAHNQARMTSAFDELILVLYTPRYLYFYKHDGTFAFSSVGLRTAVQGHQIQISGPRCEKDWTTSLRSILRKLDDETNTCSLQSVMPLTDPRISRALSQRCHMTNQIFLGAPLSDIAPAVRGKRIEALACRVDGIVNRGAHIQNPGLGHCANGSRRGLHQSAFDWCRDDIRVECKSGQLCWDRSGRRWKVSFQCVKLRGLIQFDELLLAIYTPKGIYIYRHDNESFVASNGASTHLKGHRVNLYGPCQEADWVKALDAILCKLDRSGCQSVAFVEW
ncbi:unnamed protein product [Prorocentrum cordatum]|uniref:Decapping nuclease n=1 Tax=Prorocentrum cordatum TaxID=2364126 RepID=A0ABN9TVQ3_9DINO|nr:unnamed protein product [Polarella glacialis]